MIMNIATISAEPRQLSQLSLLLIGGGLTLVGSMIGHGVMLYAARVERRHKADARKQQLLKEMADLMVESEVWLRQIRLCKTVPEIQACIPPTSTRHVVMIARIAPFPSLIDHAQNWANGYVDFYHFAIQCFDSSGPGTVGAIIGWQVAAHPEFGAIEDRPSTLRNILIKAMAEEAAKYQHA
jgi:hypothetical protein